ncbi:hypothetical protein TNCV_3962471 [Trichonephila clavipes]|nr:hypothetical protein TNCV_3962471 [Trichonephila clavipes]
MSQIGKRLCLVRNPGLFWGQMITVHGCGGAVMSGTISPHCSTSHSPHSWCNGLGGIACDSRFTLIVMRGTLTDQRYVDDILQPYVGPFLNGLPGANFQTSYEETNKLETEIPEKLKSILVLAECLRNSIPIPLNYEDCTSERLEISDNNEKTIHRKTYKHNGSRSKKTLARSSTQTDCAEVIVAKNTGTISKRSNRNYKSSEGKKPAASRVPDKPPRKSIVSLPPDRKPPQKSVRSLPEPSRKPVFLPVTSISSSKASFSPGTKPPRKSEGSCPVTSTSSSKETSPLETKPLWKSAASLPAASTSSSKTKSFPPKNKPPRKPLSPDPVATSNPSSKIEKSKIPDDKSRLGNKRTRGKWQNKLKDGAKKVGAPSTRQKQAPPMDPKKLVASKTDQASSCFVQAEPESATAPREEKQQPGRILKRRNAVFSKTGHRFREKTN